MSTLQFVFAVLLLLSFYSNSIVDAKNRRKFKFYYQEQERLQTLSDKPIPYELCGGQHVKLINATATDWPPQSGQTLTFTAFYSIDETVTKGTYKAHVDFDSFPIYDKTGDLSEYGFQYPVTPGIHNISQTVQIPTIPDGDLEVKAQILDQDNNLLLCIKISNQNKAYLRQPHLEHFMQKMQPIMLPQEPIQPPGKNKHSHKSNKHKQDFLSRMEAWLNL